MNDIESGIYEWAKENAEQSGYKLNPDYDIVVQAIKGLALHKAENGEQYCSCRPVPEDKKTAKELICPCTTRAKDIDKRGACRCALFVI